MLLSIPAPVQGPDTQKHLSSKTFEYPVPVFFFFVIIIIIVLSKILERFSIGAVMLSADRLRQHRMTEK